MGVYKMSDLNTQYEYTKEIEGLASNIVTEAIQTVEENNGSEFDGFDDTKEAAMDLIHDTYLHETIDGHQWVIYCGYNLDVLKYSDNPDYMIDNLGGESEILASQGLSGLHTALAFWAMYADVQDALESAFTEYENSL
jgi:hypothetical protein